MCNSLSFALSKVRLICSRLSAPKNKIGCLIKGKYAEFEAFTNAFLCVSGNSIATELAKNEAIFSFCQVCKSFLMTMAILF